MSRERRSVRRPVNAAGMTIHQSSLPAATGELVKLRASQINGCGSCTDTHTKDALAAGETGRRLRARPVGDGLSKRLA